jgi:RHS repeat-associated protein
VYSEAYNPYGGVQKTWTDSFDPLPKFSGKERDKESELDYFGARYYDRSQYRFISVDPVITLKATLSDPQLWNRYWYCSSNPLRYTDHTGKYGKNFHFNTTVYLAMKAGFSHENALVIAEFCQKTDSLPTTKPSGALAKDTWHYAGEPVINELKSRAKDSGDRSLIGFVAHSIGDSHGAHSNINHENYLDIGKKHVGGCDKTSTDPLKTLNVEQEILNFFLECNNREPGTMTIDTGLCLEAAKNDSDPITILLQNVASALSTFRFGI